MFATMFGTPTLWFTRANTVGPSPRIRFASRAITSRSAPTWGKVGLVDHEEIATA